MEWWVNNIKDIIQKKIYHLLKVSKGNKMRFAIIICVALFAAIAAASPTDRANQTKACEATLTTVSGRFAPGGQLCKDQLIFDEQFNNLNLELWGHEVKLRSDVSKIFVL